MLPVSHERPDYPLVLIDDRSLAPAFPQIQDARIAHLLIDIAIHIVNTAVSNASRNSARMFTFNMLAKNNWYNEHFEDVFRLSVDHLLFTMQGSAAPPQALYKNSVEKVVTMYCSQLVMEYPELQGLVTPQTLHASRENAGYFHHFKQEIAKMQGHSYQLQQPNMGQGQPMMYGQQGPQPFQGGFQMTWVIDPASGQAIQAMVPVGGQPMGNQGGRYPQQVPPSRVNPHFQNIGGMARMPDMAPRNPSGRNYGIGEPKQSAPEAPRGRSLGDNFVVEGQEMSSQSGVQGGDLRPGPYVGSRHARREEYEPEVLLNDGEKYDTHTSTHEKGETNVDRSKHELGIKTSVVTVDEQANTDRIQTLAEDAKIELNKKLQIVESLEIGVAQMRADSANHSEKVITRQFALVADYLISTVDAQAKTKNWLTGTSLSAVALSMQAAFKTLANQEASRMYNELSLLRELDRRLTDKVNTFLRQKLEATFDIDSFKEDYPNVPVHVLKKMGRSGADALAAFEIGLFNQYDDTILATLRAEETVKLDPKRHLNVSVAFLPSVYSLTLVPLDRETMGLAWSDKSKVLLTHRNKYLFNILKTLFQPVDPEDDVLNGMYVDQHILITLDGAAYRVHKTFDKDELTLIKL